MKDIVLITAYCPDNNRIEKLRRVVTQLSKFKDYLDIIVVSHTPIPTDIQDKLNLSLYDEKNELLTDWDLINQPWFAPNNNRTIQSGLLSGRNTHLAIYRMLILGLSIIKNSGYKKVHVLEYDCEIKNIDEFMDNSKLLDDYYSVYYLDKQKGVSDIFFGSVFSLRVDKLPDDLINLNEENIKKEIRESLTKSPEGITQSKLHKNGKYFVKNRDVIETSGNQFATSVNDDGFNPWGVPFVDLLNDEVKFVCWNQKKKNGVNNIIIINDNKVFNTGNVNYGTWLILNLGDLKDINKITVIEDDRLRKTFIIDTEDKKELFKKMSFMSKN